MSIIFANRLKDVHEYYFSKKLDLIAQMRKSGIEVINLGIGSPDMSPSDVVIEVTTKALSEKISHGYSSYRSSPELRLEICNWLSRTYKIKVEADNEVLPLLGSKEGILYLSMALLNPGDTVLIPNPGYPAYSSVAKLLGAKIIYYDLLEENNWLPDLNKIEKEDLKNCKLMWVNYPHMPSGQSASKELFTTLVSFANKYNIHVCNDNPYGLILNTENPISLISADPIFKNSSELNSFSKTFNMAGWRIGFLIGSNELINAVISIKSNVDSGMFIPIQKGAIQALKSPESWHEKINTEYTNRRKIVWKIFDLLGFTYSKNQVGLFVWAKAPSTIRDIESYVDELLLNAHVFLTPGSLFGSNGSKYARASLCSSEENLEKAFLKLRKYLA